MKNILSVGILCLTLCFAVSCTKNENSPSPIQANAKQERVDKSGNLSWAVNLLLNDNNFQAFAQNFADINAEITAHMASLTPAQKRAAIASVEQDGSPENLALNWGYTLSKEFEMDRLFARIMANNASLSNLSFSDLHDATNQAIVTMSFPCFTDACCWNHYNSGKGSADNARKEGFLSAEGYAAVMKTLQNDTNACLAR